MHSLPTLSVRARPRSPLAASALARVAVAALLCVGLWLTVAWALDWGAVD
ncbi:hypothetical protein [Azospirillum sp. TSO35-2]|nr:hypothetical protein [Azospirillum sp. TSO35-2]